MAEVRKKRTLQEAGYGRITLEELRKAATGDVGGAEGPGDSGKGNGKAGVDSGGAGGTDQGGRIDVTDSQMLMQFRGGAKQEHRHSTFRRIFTDNIRSRIPAMWGI